MGSKCKIWLQKINAIFASARENWPQSWSHALGTPSVTCHVDHACQLWTSNVTGRHRGIKQKLRATGCLQSAVTETDVMSQVPSLQRTSYFSSSMVSHAFSVLCMYSKFWASSTPQGSLYAKFCFCGNLHCSPSPWKKITYSITHSPSHPAYFIPQETNQSTCASEKCRLDLDGTEHF